MVKQIFIWFRFSGDGTPGGDCETFRLIRTISRCPMVNQIELNSFEYYFFLFLLFIYICLVLNDSHLLLI